MATTGTNHGWGAESRSRERLVTAGSGKGLWCRARPCGALSNGRLRRAGACEAGQRRLRVRSARLVSCAGSGSGLLGPTVGSGRGGNGSGGLKHGGVGACGGTGQTQGTEAALGRGGSEVG